MDDEEIDYSQPVEVFRPARILLGLVVLLTGAALGLLGLVFLLTPAGRAEMPPSAVTVIFLGILILLGLAITYVGARLLVMKEGEGMLSPNATFVGGVFMVFLGSMAILFALYMRTLESLEFVATGVAVAAWGVWLVRSSRASASR